MFTSGAYHKSAVQTQTLFHNIKRTNTTQPLAWCNSVALRKTRGFLGKNPQATHFELLLALAPLLERRYRDALDKTDHVWTRFKDVDGEGVLLVDDGYHTTMFNTTQMLDSVLQRVNLNDMRVQDRLETSPKQALNELTNVGNDWDDLTKRTLLRMNGIVPTTHVEEILPIDVIERVLDDCDFSKVGVRVQQNFLQLLSKRQEHICRLVLCGFVVSTRAMLLSLVRCNLTKWKMVNCSYVDVGRDSLFSFSALATIADTCDALESLEILGSETLSKIGSRNTPLRFSSFIVLHVERCPVLSSIGVIIDRAIGSGEAVYFRVSNRLCLGKSQFGVGGGMDKAQKRSASRAPCRMIRFCSTCSSWSQPSTVPYLHAPKMC